MVTAGLGGTPTENLQATQAEATTTTRYHYRDDGCGYDQSIGNLTNLNEHHQGDDHDGLPLATRQREWAVTVLPKTQSQLRCHASSSGSPEDITLRLAVSTSSAVSEPTPTWSATMDPLPDENIYENLKWLVGPRNYGAPSRHHHDHGSGGLSVIQVPALLQSVLPSAPCSGAADITPGLPVATVPEAALAPSIQPLGADQDDTTLCLRLAGTAWGEAGVRWRDQVEPAVALRCPSEGNGCAGSLRTHSQGQGEQREGGSQRGAELAANATDLEAMEMERLAVEGYEPHAAPSQDVRSKGEERMESADLLRLNLNCTPPSHTLNAGDAALRWEDIVGEGGDVAENSQQQSARSNCWHEAGRLPHECLEMQRGMAFCDSFIGVVNPTLHLSGTGATNVHDAALAAVATAIASKWEEVGGGGGGQSKECRCLQGNSLSRSSSSSSRSLVAINLNPKPTHSAGGVALSQSMTRTKQKKKNGSDEKGRSVDREDIQDFGMTIEGVAVWLRRSGGGMSANGLCGQGQGQGKEAEHIDSQTKELAVNTEEGKEGAFEGAVVSGREGVLKGNGLSGTSAESGDMGDRMKAQRKPGPNRKNGPVTKACIDSRVSE